MKKVFISGKIPEIAYKKLSEKYEVSMHDDITLLSKDEIIKGIQGADALLCLLSDKIDKEVIESNKNLKVIANYGAGFDNIDIKTAREYGIPVTNTPLVSTISTAELTIGLMLGISRRMVEGDAIVRAGKFTGWSPLYQLGYELKGKTLGIIGMGNIGKAVAKRARAFEMNIIYYNRSRLSTEKEEELGVTYVEQEDLIRESDYISLHVSYSPELHHFFNKDTFARMKPSAFLINAARGKCINEKDLLEALENKVIKGAALDVYEFEPAITEGLEKLDNIIMTPHIGNATVEARTAMAEIAADNIIDVLSGKEARNKVN